MDNKQLMNLLKVVFISVPPLMVCLVYSTSMKSNMFHLPPQVLDEPWFKTTLVDFYFNIFIISVWVIYKERLTVIALLWIISFICLGSIATSFYVFLQLIGLKEGDGIEKILLRKNK